MKICSNCHYQVDDNVKFCPKCGAKIEDNQICPKCGTIVNKEDKFCPSCGNQLESCNHNQLSNEQDQINVPVQSSSTIQDFTQNPDKKYYEEESFYDKYKIYIFIGIGILMVAIGLLCFHYKTNEFIPAEDTCTVDTSAVQENVEEREIVEDFSSQLIATSFKILTFTSTVEGRKEANEDAECDEIYFGDNPRTFSKGETYYMFGHDALGDGIEQEGEWSKFVQHGTGEDYAWYVPSNSYKMQSFKQGKIPCSVLDKYVLSFVNSENDTLRLFRLSLNGHKLSINGNKISSNDKQHMYCIMIESKSSERSAFNFLTIENGFIILDNALNDGAESSTGKRFPFDSFGNVMSDAKLESYLNEWNSAFLPQQKFFYVDKDKYVFVRGLSYLQKEVEGRTSSFVTTSSNTNSMKPDNKSKTTTRAQEGVSTSFTSPSQVRIFLCAHDFKAKNGATISFRDEGNTVYYKGRALSSIQDIIIKDSQSCLLTLSGPYGTTHFVLSSQYGMTFMADVNDVHTLYYAE